MQNKTSQSTIVADYFEDLAGRYELPRKELEKEQRALKDRTTEEHQSIIDALRPDAPASEITKNISDYIANLAKWSGLEGKEDLIRQCAIAAKTEQRNWWHKYGRAKKFGFRSSQQLSRGLKKIKSVRCLVKDPGYQNSLTLAPPSDSPASERECLLEAFSRLCTELEAATEAAIGQLPNMGRHTRYDLRLMILAPQAFWHVHKPRQSYEWDAPLAERSAWFVHAILWLVDRSITPAAIKYLSSLSPSNGCLGMHDLEKKFENYCKSFGTSVPIDDLDPTEIGGATRILIRPMRT